MDPADRLLSTSLVESMLAVGRGNPVYVPAGVQHVLSSPEKNAVYMDHQGEISDEIGKMAQEVVEEAVSNEVFARYKYNEILPGCQPHPGDVVEAGPLADLPLPPPTYPLSESLPEELITSNKLSSLQLEGVLYACQRHQRILPNGNRAGFFIGDGAGVGKGRQIAGIILDNFGRGRTKSVWFSISSDLIMDARRDLTDIGCYVKVIEGCQQLDKETRVLGLPADFKHGVIFSTYATLVSSVQRGSSKQSRLQQLVDWCGGTQFDGCLIFDECHKAKNFVPGKEQASTKVALSVATIQRMLPKARVVYCSATGVTDVKNMAFMERLGLWGEGAPFRSFEHFLDSVHRKGLGVAEMLAMEMKSSGMYVSRGLSFKDAEFVTVEAALTKEQIKMYDVAAHVWSELRKSLEHAVLRTKISNNRIWSSFWGAHQRFFKQLCMGMKVPTIIEEARSALEQGFCVVIGLQTTGEASLESELNKPGAVKTGFVSLCKEILHRFIQQHFPTVIEGVTQGSAVDDWSVTAKTMLLGFVQQIQLPNSPLDEIIDQLGGPDCVAEMTGRRGRMVRRSQKDKPAYELRDSDSGVQSLNISERNQFMEGKKFVAIISDAASTGISLHADQRAGNQRRRVHLTIELPWSADKAVQQLGRSHRSNQTSGPLYKLVTTDLGGERRFAAAVARRLQSLGALTKGDRRAATGADLTEFNFDTPYGRTSLRTMYHAICQKELAQGVEFSKVNDGDMDLDAFHENLQEMLVLMGLVDESQLRVSAQVKDKDHNDVGKFLNRILGLQVVKQNMIFTYFTESLNAVVQSAKKEGRYNEGMLDIMASSVEMVTEPKEVFKRTARKTHSVTKHVVLKIDRGLSWEAAMIRFNNHKGKQDGFYWSRREIRGRRLYTLLTQKEGSSHLVKVARPNTGVSVFDEEKADMLAKYSPITPEEAEDGWKQQYEDSKEHCMHGRNCKAGPVCTVGTRTYRISLLCGGVVTLMSLLEATLMKHASQLSLSKSECHLRVVRVQLNSGDRVVGIRYPEALIPVVEIALDEQLQIDQFMKRQPQQQVLLTNGLLPSQPSIPQQSEAGNAPSVSQAEVEPATAINKKWLNNALTPPLTIKNFFKPKSLTSELNDKSSDTHVDKKPAKGTENNEIDTNVCFDKTVNDKKECGTTSQVADVGDKPKSEQKWTEISSYFGKGQKRPLSPGDQPATSSSKKPKQTSLKNLFAKQSSIKERKESSCPICKITFKPGTFNSEINEHIDNCLIE